MKKTVSLILTLAMALCAFAGCTGSSEPASSADAATDSTASAADPTASSAESATTPTSTQEAAAKGVAAAEGSDPALLEGDSYEIRMAHTSSEGSPNDYGMTYFKNKIETATGGRVTVTIHPSTITANDVEGLEILRAGNLEGMWTNAGAYSGFCPDVGLFQLPFLFDSTEHIDKCLTGEFGDRMLELASTVEGIEVGALGIDGWRYVIAKDKVITKLEDMQGVRVRCMQDEVNVAMYEALGAVPITLPYSELYTSLQTGLVDGQDNAFIFAAPDGLVDVLNTACTMRLFFSGGLVVFNEDWLNARSEIDREMILTAAEECGAVTRAWWDARDQQHIDDFTANPDWTITTEADVTDRDKWVEAVQPVYDSFYEKYPHWEELVALVDAER